MVNGSLEEIIKQEKKGLPPPNWNATKKHINLYGISSAMMHLHSNNIIHRDLKPGNILEDENFSDFSLAKYGNENDTISVGTPIFMAPELFEEKGYSNKTDVYSFGMTMLLLFGGEVKTNTYFEHYNKISKGKRPSLDMPIHESYKKLIT